MLTLVGNWEKAEVKRMRTGLLSVTFRKLSPNDIIKLVSEAGLEVIEWGGDIHVPHGDVKIADEIGRKTREVGIEVVSYGSYYYAGQQTTSTLQFEHVLASACALKAPAIRVWAGNQGSDEASMARRQEVILDARRIADLAQVHNTTIDFEFHGGTLTDSTESAVHLLQEIDHPNVRCNWQPQTMESYDNRMASLLAILPWLANIHVFHWVNGERQSLSDGKSDWRQYLSIVMQTGKKPHVMLEFVKDDDPGQFVEDAETLKDTLSFISSSE